MSMDDEIGFYDEDQDGLSEHPVWRQAAKDAVREFDYGDVIPHSWIAEHLEIEDPTGWVGTVDAYRALAFDLLRKMDNFRAVMLTEHKRYMVNVRGLGYKIIEPPHQTDAAMLRLQDEMRRSLAKAMSALVHINETAISMDDARENAEAKAKLAWINTIGVKKLARVPDSDETTGA